MLSLTLGLIAALAWGIHDICVRYVSQRGSILPSLATVLLAGTVILIPISTILGDWTAMTGTGIKYSVFGGAVYLFGCIGLYKAFAIGPVRLVAPIVGAYPILSITWAGISGQAISFGPWVAVGCVVLGVAIVGFLSQSDEDNGSTRAAIGWAILGGAGFAGAFAIGHIATQVGDELPIIFVTRLAATIGVLGLLLLQSRPKLPNRSAWPFLAAMALLDTMAHSIVIGSGNLYRPEFAAVSASMFGMVTVVLAWLFLRERMTLGQWGGVMLAFAAVGYLAF
jgi:drug/metabolite transporter (DMT)-like permease